MNGPYTVSPYLRVFPLEPAAGLSWQDLALCAETDPEAFFPEKGGSTREAKRVCGSCEVRAQCLEYAVGHGIREGIWGGLSDRERRRLKRPPAPAPALTPAAGARSRSRFRGVTWAEGTRKWRARARLGGERVYLGVFASEEAAGRAVAEAEAAYSRKTPPAPVPHPRKAVA